MNGKIPHIVQYQGSKRVLAPQILQYMPERFNRLIEPFSGMAAISIATAYENRTNSFLVNDLNKPLVDMLQEAIEKPVRERFNNGEKTSANMLYLLARCVKGAVRYGKNGNFNQSPDKRRHGTNPKTLAQNVYKVSRLLKGKTEFVSKDYHEILEMAQPGDLVYMDPPYQGVTNVRDNRYFSGVPFDEFAESLKILNKKGVDYLISYDGECGGKEYGEDLPEDLKCKKVMLNAGLSSQALLLGKKETTFEALYISEALIQEIDKEPEQLSFMEAIG